MKNKALLAIKQEIEYLRALQIYYEIIFDLFPLENRYNHNHGPDGKFTSGSGTAAGVDNSGKSGIIGLGSGSVSYQAKPHDPPKYIKKIDISDTDAVEKELKDFETQALVKDYETACVITKSGEVYHCFGVKDEVYPDVDLKDKLQGAIVSHNHIITETEYSFGSSDLRLFEKYELQRLRGCDHRFSYEISRMFSDVDPEPIDWDSFENIRHSMVIDFALNRGYGYRRARYD